CSTDPTAARHHVAVAAGSGITPVLSLLTTALEEEPHSRATLIFGNRRTDSIMFLEELMELKNRFPGRFSLFNVLSRERQDLELFTGRIDRDKLEALLATFVPEDEVDEWYLCGPFGMVETARAVLAERAVDPEHVHHEIFHVDDSGGIAPPPVVEPVDPGAPPEAVVNVTLDGRTTTVPMSTRAESILDATLRERPDAPFSCTGGVCGTCRAKVVDGEVRMDRNYALEPDEVERGYRLMCQSHPVSDTVTIDYAAGGVPAGRTAPGAERRRARAGAQSRRRRGSSGASSAATLPVTTWSASSCPVTGPRVIPHMPWPPETNTRSEVV